MYKNILVATDLMDNANDLLNKATAVAKQNNAELHLVHVIEPPISAEYAAALGFAAFPDPDTDDARTVLKTLAEAFSIDEEHQHVLVGPVANQTVNLAQSLNCDLILIGSHASHGIEDLLGSTANAILDEAQCDVLTFKFSAND